jgi:DNA-binding MurR/RpiR family transcriptional regulator
MSSTVSESEAGRLLAEYGYQAVFREHDWVIYQHQTALGQVFALDWSQGDMSNGDFLFVLEHNGENRDAIAAYLESR